MLPTKEKDRLHKLNASHGYGMSYNVFSRLVREHEAGDAHEREKIEYRLTDINFHYECGLLKNGRYEEALNSWY